MTKRKEQSNNRKFELAFLAGERNDKLIHTHLTSLLVDFHKQDNNTTCIFNAVSFMVKTNQQSHRTQAVCKWLVEVCGFKVVGHNEKDDNVKVSCALKKPEYDTAWLDGAKNTPWYSVARDMQKPQPWREGMDSVISNQAAGILMGVTTEEALKEMFTESMVLSIMAKTNDEDFIDKVDVRIQRLQAKGMKLAA